MWWCFAWASLITAMAEWYFSIRGKFQAPVHSFISLFKDKVEHFAADKLRRNVLLLKSSLSLKQPAYKSSTLPAHQLGQGPLVQLCKKHSLYRLSTTECGEASQWDKKQGYQQFWQTKWSTPVRKTKQLQAVSFTDGSGNNSEIKAEYNLGSSFHLGCLCSLYTSSLHLWN